MHDPRPKTEPPLRDSRIGIRHSPVFATSLLMAASACSYVDRQILSLLVVPIQTDLGLSDTAVSLLLGMAFALSYALLGVPFGYLVDRRRRWSIVSAGVAFWSMMTAACGLAGNFWQLFLFRMGVGAGEATLNPSAYSLLPDLVPREKVGIAVAAYGVGIYFGSGVALLIGGQVVALVAAHPDITIPFIGPLRSWQAGFLVVAMLGAPIALIAKWMPEPKRSGGTSTMLVSEVIAFLRQNIRSYGLLVGSWSFLFMSAYGLSAWFPTFMVRTFDWTVAEIGIWFGLAIVVGGCGGSLLGGYVSDRWAHEGVVGRLRALMVLSIPPIPFALAFPLVENGAISLILCSLFFSIQAGAAATVPVALQELLPARMRGVGSAIAIAFASLFGLGLGPIVIALITDLGFGDKAMLRYSLATAIPITMTASWLCAFLAKARLITASHHGKD